MIAGLLAIIFTFLNGSPTFAASITAKPPQWLTPLQPKEDICLDSFVVPLCGKNNDFCFAKITQNSSTSAFLTSAPSHNFAFEFTTAKADPTPTPSNTVTTTPTPTVAVQAAIAYNTAPTLAENTSEALDADLIFTMINQIRSQNGLAPFEKSDFTCQLANERAPEVYGEIMSGTMHAGMRRRNLDWHTNENIIFQNTESGAVNWWMNSPVHRSALLGAAKHACVKCSGHSCSMIFTDY